MEYVAPHDLHLGEPEVNLCIIKISLDIMAYHAAPGPLGDRKACHTCIRYHTGESIESVAGYLGE